MFEDWITAVSAELGITDEVDVEALLALARDVAHDVARPAAPVTSFLVGLAAGRAGGSAADVAGAIATAQRLAAGWSSAERE